MRKGDGVGVGDSERREAFRKTEAEENSGGWQALLSAESDMAVGDRWQNQKVMSLLTGSACAPLISPVPPRHHHAHLCSSCCLSVSAKMADRMAGRKTEDGHSLKQEGSIGSIRNATPESSQPPFSSCCLFFLSICLTVFITLNRCDCLCSLLTTSVAQAVCRSACCCFVYTVYSLKCKLWGWSTDVSVCVQEISHEVCTKSSPYFHWEKNQNKTIRQSSIICLGKTNIFSLHWLFFIDSVNNASRVNPWFPLDNCWISD